MNVVELRNITKKFQDVIAVDSISFAVKGGQIIALLGPSGCGKTTTLRLIAGFEMPDEGEVLLSGCNMRGIRPYERNVGILFQDYALFPHMTVADNVAYGLRRRGFDSSEVRHRTGEMLALVKLTGYESRRPIQLSGGEQQRVALARALATNPEVMLLDEPLSALDAKLRQELRVELKEILSNVGSTTIVVTHDQEEAMSLAEHIIVMRHGRIMQEGSPTDIYDHPASKFVSEFIGRSNWFSGRLERIDASGIGSLKTSDGITLRVTSIGMETSANLEVCVRPERIDFADLTDAEQLQSDRLNALPGTVIDAAPQGALVHVVIELDTGKRIFAVEKNLGQRMRQPGEVIVALFKPEDCTALVSEN